MHFGQLTKQQKRYMIIKNKNWLTTPMLVEVVKQMMPFTHSNKLQPLLSEATPAVFKKLSMKQRVRGTLKLLRWLLLKKLKLMNIIYGKLLLQLILKKIKTLQLH